MTVHTDEPQLSFSRRIRYRAEAAFVFALMGLFRVMGLDGASAFGGFIGRKFLFRMKSMNRARENLRAAFPEKSEEQIEAIVLEMCDNLGRTVAEYAHLDKLKLHGENHRLEFLGTEHGDNAYARGKGVIFFSGHFANWETMPFAAAHFGYKGGEVYRPMNNPYVDRWVVARRKKNGTPDQIAKGPRGTRQIFTTLRRGEGVFLLADQKTNEGIPIPFFGRDAMTTPAPAMLALKRGATLIPASNERIGGARFRIRLHAPLEFTPTGDDTLDVYNLTLAITQKIEEMVRYRPSQWLWYHRRWPTQREQDNILSKRALEALEAATPSTETDHSNAA